ncbi:hypothetical protein D3C73_1643990 [compost metagenome]
MSIVVAMDTLQGFPSAVTKRFSGVVEGLVTSQPSGDSCSRSRPKRAAPFISG